MMEPRQLYDLRQLEQAWELFKPGEGEAVELRALNTDRNAAHKQQRFGGTVSGYFNQRKAFVEAGVSLSGHAEGVYVTLNCGSEELLGRGNNRLVSWAKT